MSLSSRGFISGSSGAILGAVIALFAGSMASTPVALLTDKETVGILGADCDATCTDQTCPQDGCPGDLCEPVCDTTKCQKSITSANRTRMDVGHSNASETSSGDCGVKHNGDQVQGECPESACGTAGSGCGGTKYVCTSNTKGCG
jgi:hypothetical protein